MYKWINRVVKTVFIAALCFSVAALGSVGVLQNSLPKDYNVIKGNELQLNLNMPIDAVKSNAYEKEKYDVTLKLLGVIPVSSATVNVVDENTVEVLGRPFGIKIYTDGVMIVGITEVDTETGNQSPAKEAGLQIGDLILSIDGQKVLSNEEVAAIIESSGGKDLTVEFMRENKTYKIKMKPAKSSSSGKFKAGLWVRDSSAGIGTQTFYSPSRGIIAGLGHGICDVDTGEILTINSGQMVDAEILSVEKGKQGEPGELKGRFLTDVLGNLTENNDTGVYAAAAGGSYTLNNLKKVALKQEITVGDAKIYTTIDGKEPRYYNCRIEKIAYNDSITKNMIIKITDAELIEKTGGIVQGMSGSPILQNNKFVGAVTHVFVNDSTKGYAIFAENMLATAQSVAAENYKEAS